jgi:hypothetical protein
MVACHVQPGKGVENFNPGDDVTDLPTVARRIGWLRLVLTGAVLVIVALVIDVVAGRPLAGWHESLLSNLGGVLVLVYVFFVFVGMRARPRPPGY